MSDNNKTEEMMQRVERAIDALRLPAEDINKHMADAADTAAELAKKQGGLHPMLDILVMREDKGHEGELERIGIGLDGVDFDSKQDRLRAIMEAGRHVGEKHGNKLKAIQATLIAEAWQRTEEPGDRVEVIIAASGTWDKRYGIITQRVIRDTDDSILGVMPSHESLVGDKDSTVEAGPIELFFLGFGVGAAQYTNDQSIKDKASAVDKKLKSAIACL